MRSVAEHQHTIAELITPRPAQWVPLVEAAGRVLAADVVAARALPGFDNSAMDGYAARARDVAAASAAQPIRLPVTADIPAGRPDTPRLEPGAAHRIMTGAPIPVGADTILPVEITDGATDVVAIYESRPVGQHIRRTGEDVAQGETVLRAGTLLGAAQIGLLAALGESHALIIPPVRVLVLSTGSELVAPGEPLAPGQIHESNTIMLVTAIREAGAVAEQLHFVADEVDEFLARVTPALGEVDLLVTSGGVSAGAYEVVKDALSGRGVEFVKVGMQPGMPQGCGRFQGTPTVTLPGNPVSALVSFEVFLRPVLRRAMGLEPSERRVVRLPLASALTSPAGKRQFRRGILEQSPETGGQVDAIGPPASHFLRWLAVSNALIDIPADTTALTAGTLVDVWLLD